MEDLICYCPVCGGHVLGLEARQVYKETAAVIGKLYCPHCEMLVEPVAAPVDVLNPNLPPVFTPAPDYAGRSAADGSNAGGSQRGDLSDQGATQWRSDPRSAERETWSSKE